MPYPKQRGSERIDSGRQHALGFDARLARRIESQQVHDDVADDGQVVGGHCRCVRVTDLR